MSWLDLPPMDGPTPSLAAAQKGNDGPVKVLLGLVGGGIVGCWTEYGMDLWKPTDPAKLAGVLGMDEVERVDMGDGFAEVGHIDTDRNILIVRNRNPHSGDPRRFQLKEGTFPDRNLDPYSVWQLKRMADIAVRRGGRWMIQPGGYGTADLSISFELGKLPDGQRRIIISAMPAWVAKPWPTGRLGSPRPGRAEPTRSTAFPVTKQGVDQAVNAIVAAMRESGLESYELMPTFPSA